MLAIVPIHLYPLHPQYLPHKTSTNDIHTHQITMTLCLNVFDSVEETRPTTSSNGHYEVPSVQNPSGTKETPTSISSKNHTGYGRGSSVQYHQQRVEARKSSTQTPDYCTVTDQTTQQSTAAPYPFANRLLGRTTQQSGSTKAFDPFAIHLYDDTHHSRDMNRLAGPGCVDGWAYTEKNKARLLSESSNGSQFPGGKPTDGSTSAGRGPRPFRPTVLEARDPKIKVNPNDSLPAIGKRI